MNKEIGMPIHKLSNSVRPRGARVFCLLVGFLLAGSSVQATLGATEPAAEHPNPATKRGAEIFQKRCVSCHNKQPGDESPFGPPNLYSAFRGTPPLSVHDAENIIRNGKGNMPPFGSILSPSDIRSVIAYLRKR
jgi:mono/diheme cytochrome c family protein